jgi:pre-60S factor REI1
MDSDVESVDSFGDEDGLGIEECLFCSHISSSLEENMKHMTVKHSFFLPDAEYISDLEALITYLGKYWKIHNI